MMKKPLLFISISTLLSIAFHIYLSMRAQVLLKGEEVHGFSICHVNSWLSCDNTLLSDYAHFIGLSLSDWGLATHLIIFCLLIILLLGLVEHSVVVWATLCFFSILSAGASLVFAGLSYFLLNIFCPICIILYFLSFITCGCIIWILSNRSWIEFSFLRLFRSVKSVFFLSIVLTWVFLAFLSHQMFIYLNQNNSTKYRASSFLLDWRSAPVEQTKQKPLLEKGSKDSQITITEFADFLCPHCKNSYYLLKVFHSSHSDIRIRFFSFSLDRCQNDSGISCFLTQAVWCAKNQDHGWSLHDLIFKNQEQFLKTNTIEKTQFLLKKIVSPLSLNWNNLEKCIQSPESRQIAKNQILAGEDMKITGTPSLFVNGKKTTSQYFIQTLQSIRKHILQKAP